MEGILLWVDTPLIDYAFEYASPYFGQARAGSPHHFNETFDGTTMNCKMCPKIVTDNDNGIDGPGHIPPHIALAAVTSPQTWIWPGPEGTKRKPVAGVFATDMYIVTEDKVLGGAAMATKQGLLRRRDDP